MSNPRDLWRKYSPQFIVVRSLRPDYRDQFKKPQRRWPIQLANPAYAHSGSAQAQSGATFTVSLTNTTGNMLVAYQLTSLAGGTSPATPTGWTKGAGTPLTISSGHELVVWYRTGNGSASYTFNNAGGGLSPTASCQVFEFTNASSTPEQIVTATGNSGTADPGSITPGNVGDLFFTVWAIGTNALGSILNNGTYSIVPVGTIGDSGGLQRAGCKSPASTSPVASNTAILDSSEPWATIAVVLSPGAVPAVQGAPQYNYSQGGLF